MAVLQLTVGQWRGSIGEDDGARGQCGADGGPHDVGTVAAQGLQLAGGLEHLGGDVGGALLVGGAGRGQLVVAEGVVGALVGHDGHGSELAEQQPVVVGTHESGLPAIVLDLVGRHGRVATDVVDEDGCLVDALIASHPCVLSLVLVVVALVEGVIRSPVGVLGVAEGVVAVAVVHVVVEVEGVPCAALAAGASLGAHLDVGAVEEGVGVGEPLVGLDLVGEDALECLAVVEVFVAVEVGAGGEQPTPNPSPREGG